MAILASLFFCLVILASVSRPSSSTVAVLEEDLANENVQKASESQSSTTAMETQAYTHTPATTASPMTVRPPTTVLSVVTARETSGLGEATLADKVSTSARPTTAKPSTTSSTAPELSTTTKATESKLVQTPTMQIQPSSGKVPGSLPASIEKPIDFIPSVPAVANVQKTEASVASTHVVVPPTSAGGFLSNPASVNAGVIFLVSFLGCALLLIIIIALFQYCRRRSRSRERAPLQKLMGMTGRNGKPPGSEFSRLQQEESSDSDGF